MARRVSTMLFGFDDPLVETERALTSDDEVEAPLEVHESGRRRWPTLAGLAGMALGLVVGIAAWALLGDGDQILTQADVDQAVAEALAQADPAAPSAGEVFNQIAPSLVVVRGLSEDPDAPVNIGAGIVFNEQGDVLTAAHVISGAATIELGFPDGTTTTAMLESESSELDMAVLGPVGSGGVRVPAVLGNPRTLAIGDTVYAVGNPLGLTGSISAGVISGLNRNIPMPDDSDNMFENLIQFDAAVNQGSSGGPLLNADGQVIGIVTALADPTGEGFFVGIGFAVPIDIAAAATANGPSQ